MKPADFPPSKTCEAVHDLLELLLGCVLSIGSSKDKALARAAAIQEKIEEANGRVQGNRLGARLLDRPAPLRCREPPHLS